MEAVRGKRLEVVLLVNVVDGDLVVHLQTVQEKKQLRQLLSLIVLLFLSVLQLQLHVFNFSY